MEREQVVEWWIDGGANDDRRCSSTQCDRRSGARLYEDVQPGGEAAKTEAAATRERRPRSTSVSPNTVGRSASTTVQAYILYTARGIAIIGCLGAALPPQSRFLLVSLAWRSRLSRSRWLELVSASRHPPLF
jgi:hypothetical protein